MTALTPHEKERQRFARSRAGQIRHGMRTYIETLGVIATAYREQDHITLGYGSWDEYLEGEFDHARLQLDPEMREKAIAELRLGGLSGRAIATTLGVSRNTVAEHVQVAPGEPPAEVLGADGKTYPPARSPVVEAMTEAIEDAGERAQNAGSRAPEVEEGPRPDSAEGAELPPAPSALDHRDDTPGEAEPERATEPGAAADEGAATPASADPEPDLPPPGSGSPACEKCGDPLDQENWVFGYMRCETCDPDSEHLAGEDGCVICTQDECPTCGQPLPT